MNVILCLGGSEQRLVKGILLAIEDPTAKLVVSSFGIKRSVLTERLLKAGLKKEQFCIDYTALDTIGNFVDTLPIIQALAPKKIYIVTDDYHMKRAQAIADIVYSGLSYQLVNIECKTNTPQESEFKVNIERIQAWIWKNTGKVIRDPATLKRREALIQFDKS